ncbi:MAG: DEAD/DEAH box helicase [Gemmatimonadaceae bacterium]
MDAHLRDVNAIDGRLSLRKPQREALDLLARITGQLKLSKEYDLADALATVRREAPGVTDFDHGFPSLCFALATGVGKTRLMGAFIAYLYRAHKLKHFFVLAPNLTVYEKLKADFTPNTRKYVFPGLGDVTERLVLITGDDWQDGRGVREGDLYADDAIHVNVFNVAKINSEVRGGAAPRMKRLYEVIGESYFDYLSKLDDLVLVMDESHRYRALAGAKAIEDLKPILGLELTATPQTVQGSQARPFRNVAYNYPLANAIADGLVKEPAVATRANFDASDYSDDALERLKLEDGMQLHEQTRAHLAAYAAEQGLPLVKPFVLVVAESTAHAESVRTLMEQPAFCEGRYAGKVTVVHSNQGGEIKDENLQRLLNVESASEPTEIVIHVNKLGEGWDVTNLYTLIPLRAANSPNLVEQSLGRGLRLPYGRRTGDEMVDRLTVVSHDKFQAIIDHATRPGSTVQAFKQVLVDAATSTPLEVVRAAPLLDERLKSSPLLRTAEERSMAQLVLSVASDPAAGISWEELRTDIGKAKLTKAVMERSATAQESLGLDGVDVSYVVTVAVDSLGEHTIAIPRIALQPKSGVHGEYRPFRLDVSEVRRQPMPQEILLQALQSQEQRLVAAESIRGDGSAEDQLVRELAADSAIAYDRHAALLYDLAGQMVSHLRSYLPGDDAVANVVVTQAPELARVIRSQMLAHRDEASVEYEAIVSGDVHRPKEINGTSAVGQAALDFKAAVPDLSRMRLYWFVGFRRCLFGKQRFQSDAERRMAVLLENDADASLKWFKPANGDVRIWLRGGQAYNPDFVVETATAKYLVEPKADNEMTSAEVLEKATAGRAWCGHASVWEKRTGGKPWQYVLVPDSAITSNATLGGLVTRYG